MNNIARVFPTRTSMSPNDADAYFGLPDMFTPLYDEVHISCTFTWDRGHAEYLKYQWANHGRKVLIGGPAYDSPSNDFVPGMYLKKGVVITSRGCPNNCKKYCFVPEREGKLRELPIVAGNIVQDNNILACSQQHIDKVFEMLKGQKQIEFKGGLEARRITPQNAERLRSLKIKTLWLACDTDDGIKELNKAVSILNSVGFTRSHLFCYALIGDNMLKNENRLKKIWDIGCMPFAQLFQPKDKFIKYSHEWKRFNRAWELPAIIRARAKYNWIQWR